MNILSTSSLSTTRRYALRSRVCRAVLWLLVACFAFNGALIAAKPLHVGATKAAVAACHEGAMPAHAAAQHPSPDCCHGGCDCVCAGAHVLGEVARLSLAAVIPVTRNAVRTSGVVVALRDTAPPLRPPIA